MNNLVLSCKGFVKSVGQINAILIIIIIVKKFENHAHLTSQRPNKYSLISKSSICSLTWFTFFNFFYLQRETLPLKSDRDKELGKSKKPLE